MNRHLTILGSTGSIGEQALDVASHMELRVDALACGKNIRRAEEQIRRFRPAMAAIADELAMWELKKSLSDIPIRLFSGADGVCEMLEYLSSDICINAISGFSGLFPTVSALRRFPRVGLANKETIVAAGDIVMKMASDLGCELIPIDSEHSAIFQCLRGESPEDIQRILLTCSGGPFFGRSKEDMISITPAQALGHPTWKMGSKITVDCATLMNKGLEVIEAKHLFGVPAEKIKVVIHRESIIHSMVEYTDNAVVAQLGVSDMRLPIQYAITYPRRVASPCKALDFAAVGKFTFFEPDRTVFPLLALAERVALVGGLLPCVMNAANEVAVSRFLAGNLPFPAIATITERVVDSYPNREMPTLDEIRAADLESRKAAYILCEKYKSEICG